MVRNLGLIFKQVPQGEIKLGQDIAVEDQPFDLEQDLEEGSIIVKVIYAAIDPYMRGRLRAPEAKSYSPPCEIGKALDVRTISRVVKSKNDNVKEGTLLVVGARVAEYAVVTADALKIARIITDDSIDLAYNLSTLGMPGLTAFSSLQEIGRPKEGETIFVSAAAGAVGALVCQLALRQGLKVIGSVGDEKKVQYLKSLGIANVTNYKKESTDDALKRLAPSGVDIYYDNVGGVTLDETLNHMNVNGRIVACGAISQYNLPQDQKYGVKNLMNIIAKRLTFQGFIVGDIAPKYYAAHQKEVTAGLTDGSIKDNVDVFDGINKSGEAFVSLFSATAANFGKVMVKIE